MKEYHVAYFHGWPFDANLTDKGDIMQLIFIDNLPMKRITGNHDFYL